jgi:hypothetical protein
MAPSSHENPAFALHRFRRTFWMCLNAVMVKELFAILRGHEDRLLEAQSEVPAWLAEFIAQLDELDAGELVG